MKRVADTLGVARSNLAVQAAPARTRQRRGRRPQPDAELVAEIKALIAGQPTSGDRRIHALLRPQRHEQGGAAVNVKRVYRGHEGAWAIARTPYRHGRGAPA